MKRQNFKLVLPLLFILVFFGGYSQKLKSNPSINIWSAKWISVPEMNGKEYGVCFFKKNFHLSSSQSSFPVYVSADNHYKLFVNGTLVSIGPSRSDLLHWNYETVELAPYLVLGENVITAQVWNGGVDRAEGIISLQTGFILQGNTEAAQVINTDETWKSIKDKSYSPFPVVLKEYYVAGLGESVDMNNAILDWKTTSFQNSNWKNAKIIGYGFPKNKVGFGGPEGWLLIPSTLPPMELKQQRLEKLRIVKGMKLNTSFPKIKSQIIIPAHSEVTLLLDQTFLTNAYYSVLFSNGKDAQITIGYAESLYDTPNRKGNRDVVENKLFIGREDKIISNGKINQEFTTLSWRTYRYVNLKIITKENPLSIDDTYGTFTGYPFELLAKINSDSSEINKIFEIGWRTARLCAVDTYMDCPYYEQLQYIGDTRIQAMVSLYNSGDDRLLKNAINLIDYSRQPEGLTLSRYPTNNPQYITPFSLLFIGILHDYMMYGKDLDFVENKLNASRQILSYFEKYQQLDGTVKNLPWWNFTDWVEKDKNWFFGVRAQGNDGNSAIIDFQLLMAYQAAADMESKIGIKELAVNYDQKIQQLKSTILNKYWDSSRNLFADRSEKDLFSQHTNAIAILTGLIPEKDLISVGNKIITDKTLAPASIYFKYYLHTALTKAGFGDDYLNWLEKWRENINMGLTTWGETSDVDGTRSDCHAWGASPNIEFFRIILGIESDSPGFSSVKIEPHLGNLKNISGEIPHPNGVLKVSYSELNGKTRSLITLPNKTSGKFIWKGKIYVLKAGLNTFLN